MTMTEDELATKTDGSAKIFGMENFGNTCYCNSVLQCLYYSKPFREAVLAFPPTKPGEELPPRTKKLEVPGKTPHPFTVDPNAAVLNTSTSQSNNELGLNTVNVPHANGVGAPGTPTKENAKETSSGGGFGKRLNIFKSGGKDDETPAPSLTAELFSKETPAYEGLHGLSLGIRFPGQNLPVVGFTDDPFATPEQKKRSALVKGPIINMDSGFSSEYTMSENLFTAMKDIFESMSENSSRIGVVSPARLIEVLKRDNEPFRSSMHQDAHEFFNFMLNEVIDSVDRKTRELGLPTHGPDAPNRWIHDLFEGLLTSETKCLTCENVSRRDEQFLDLSIDLERNTSVTACLRQFSASEMLCERNKFHCDNCGGLQEAEKRMKVKKLPKILALHLKRFKFTEDMQRNLKLFHRVMYPRHFRLFNTTYDAEDPDKLYELAAVVVHIGGGPYHGHYVSVVKTEHAGWLLFDDEMVESVDPNYVFNFFGDNKGMATAYVLFYQEVSAKNMEKENLFTNEPEEDFAAAAAAAAQPRASTPVMTPKIDEEDETDYLSALDDPANNNKHGFTPVSRIHTANVASLAASGASPQLSPLKRHISQPAPSTSNIEPTAHAAPPVLPRAGSTLASTAPAASAPASQQAQEQADMSRSKSKRRGFSLSFGRKKSTSG